MNRILVIGDSIVDHYIFGKVNRFSPEDPTVPVFDIEREEYRLGGCLNVASNLKSLQPRNVVYVTSVLSDFAAKMCDTAGIKAVDSYYIPAIKRDNKLSSSEVILKTRVVNSDTGKQCCRVDNHKTFSAEVLDCFDNVFDRACLKGYDAVVVSDYNKGVIGNKTLEKLRGFEGPIFVDTKKPDLSIWKEMKNPVVKINLSEYLNIKPETDKCLDALVVTLGSEGAELFVNGETKFRLSVDNAIEDPDVCGAGDVFLAGLVSSYLECDNIYEAIRFANRAASRSVTKEGTSTVSFGEIQ